MEANPRLLLGHLGSERSAAGFPDTPAHEQPPTKRAKTISAERLRTLTGKSIEEYREFLQAMPGAGGCGEPINDGDDSTYLDWCTRKEHTCCHGKTIKEGNFMTRVQTDGLVLRACDACKPNDWRIIGAFGAGWTTERWCSAERPPAGELQPWPLPRHWYFYEQLVRRKIGADVRCLAAKTESRFDIGSTDLDSVFHKFIVEYTNRNGHTTRAELGVSMHKCKLFHTLGPKTFEPDLRWSYFVEHDGKAVNEHERMEWWFSTTWTHELQSDLVARKRKPNTREPPFSWRIEGMRVWYPWLDMAQLDKLVNGKHS
jgi:hypothetical protein